MLQNFPEHRSVFRQLPSVKVEAQAEPPKPPALWIVGAKRRRKATRRLCRFDILGKSAGQDHTVATRAEACSGIFLTVAICRRTVLDGVQTAGLS